MSQNFWKLRKTVSSFPRVCNFYLLLKDIKLLQFVSGISDTVKLLMSSAKYFLLRTPIFNACQLGNFMLYKMICAVFLHVIELQDLIMKYRYGNRWCLGDDALKVSVIVHLKTWCNAYWLIFFFFPVPGICLKLILAFNLNYTMP